MASSPTAQQPSQGAACAMVIRPVHPLAGRTGEGPPLAPAGWKWVAGRRQSDMYFFSPEGKRFRSKSRLKSYLASIPDAPSISEFRWRISLSDFDGLLPGILMTPMSACIRKKSKTRKIREVKPIVLKIKEDNSERALDLTEPVHGFTIFEQEWLISSLQKKYNEEMIEWHKSKEKADRRRVIVREAKSQLKLAKAEVALKAEEVHVIHKDLIRAHNRLDMLQRNHKMKHFSEDEIETQQKLCDVEVADLQNLFRKIANLNVTDPDFTLQFSLLLESQKLQKERLDFAEAKLRHMKVSATS